MEQQDNSEQHQLEIIEKVPDNELETPLNLYSVFRNLEMYVKIPFVLIAVLILIHTIFIARKSYDYNIYEFIKTI